MVKPKGRVWTPEQRAAARERALAYQQRQQESAPVATLPAPSDDEMLDASDQDMLTDDQSWEEAGVDGATQTLNQAGMTGRILHTRQGFLTLYDPEGNARQVPRPNLRMCLKNGLSSTCPLCKGRHKHLGPNQCPAREQLLLTSCPICQKPLYESRPRTTNPRTDTHADNYVAPALPPKATREDALQRRLNEHLMTFHPSEAYTMYGLTRAREASR